MKTNIISFIFTVLLILMLTVGLWADDIADRVNLVSKKLGCETPFMVAEDSETGGFYAEARLKDPQRLNAQGFPDAQKDFFVSILELIPGEYRVKVVPKHDMLDTAEEKLVVVKFDSAIQKSADIMASSIIIKGVITNLADVKDYISPTTYLQMVDVSPSTQAREDIAGGFFNIDSNLPKTSILPDGSFEIKTNYLKAGTYWLYLQNFKPASSTETLPEPILAKGDKYYQVYISEDVKSFIFDCGNLSVKRP